MKQRYVDYPEEMAQRVAAMHTPAAKEKLAAVRSAPGYSEAISERMNEYWADPEAREAARERAIEYWADNPEAREAASSRKLQYIEDNPDEEFSRLEKMRVTTSTSDYREGQRERAIQQWEDPDVREKTVASMNTPEYLEAISERMTQYWADPVNRLVASTLRRRYYATDYETGGARVPGGWRDAHLRAHIAYVEEHGECMVGHPECLDLIAEELA